MANQGRYPNALKDFQEGANSIGLLAKNEKAFREVYEAFRSGDPAKYQAVIKRLELTARCHSICEWIRIKECVFLCLELCGVPKNVEIPSNPRTFAEAVVRLTSNEKALSELAHIVEKRDGVAFQKFVNQFGLAPYCHLFCHWVCTIRYRLICAIICNPIRIPLPSLVVELRTAGQALHALLHHKDSFEQAVSASNINDTST